MKKLERSDAGIDYVKALARHAEKRGIREYSDEVIREFGDELQRSLGASTQSNSRIAGLRAEALFGAVVASIAGVSLLKTEDDGDVFYVGDDIAVPDYRIVTRGGSQLLVEVKTVDSDPDTARLSLSDAYVQRLRRYASHMSAELRFAVFWERVGWWTLNRLDAFAPGEPGMRQWRLDFSKAFTTNEMIVLGDYAVSTWGPLCIRVLFDPQNSDPMAPGQLGKFRRAIANMQVLSRDKVLEPTSAKLGWKLIWFGRWQELEPEYHFDSTHLAWVDFPFVPQEWDSPDFDRSNAGQVGFVSEMISRAYLSQASRTVHTSSKHGAVEPGYMSSLVPENWFTVDRDLPLVVLQIEPNFDYKESSDNSDGGTTA
jgi:hypothetical protein